MLLFSLSQFRLHREQIFPRLTRVIIYSMA